MTRSVRLAARQALLDQRSFWRSVEYALFTFAFPLMILLLVGAANVGSYLPGTHVKNTTVFVPGILAFGVIVAAYVNLGSKVAVLRHDGVLKRIKTTPLPSAAYFGGLVASTVATVILITACTGLIGWLAFGADPRRGGLLTLSIGLILGIVCFATLGLAISSVITSAESAGPIAYASFLPIAIISGVFDPTFSGLPRGSPAWWPPSRSRPWPSSCRAGTRCARSRPGTWPTSAYGPPSAPASSPGASAGTRRVGSGSKQLSSATASNRPPGPPPGPWSRFP